MTSLSRLTARLFGFTAAGIVIYAVIALLAGWGDLQARISALPWFWVPPLLLLSGLNYGLRYQRWQFYLGRLGARLPRAQSAAIFFSTLLMVVTPGKLGEVFKAALLRQRHDVPLTLGLPILLAERLLDLVAVVLLALGGLLAWQALSAGLVAGIAAAGAIALLPFSLHSARVRRFLGRHFERIAARAAGRLDHQAAMEATATLLRGPSVAAALLLSVPAWACEAVELALICHALGAPIGPMAAVFIYSAATLVGSLSFLPGGLGGTEAVMIALLGTSGVPGDVAVAATLLVRVTTLWLAVVVGLAVLLARRDLLAAGSPVRDC